MVAKTTYSTKPISQDVAAEPTKTSHLINVDIFTEYFFVRKLSLCFAMLNLWTIAELRKSLHRFVRALSDALEPPEVAVDQIKFEPARSAAVKIALDAGWIQGLADGCPRSPSELVTPGQSEELLSMSP
jgi:hypothetical protein